MATYSDSSFNPQIFLLKKPNLDPSFLHHIESTTQNTINQRESNGSSD